MFVISCTEKATQKKAVKTCFNHCLRVFDFMNYSCHTVYIPSRVPSSPIIVFIDVIICCAIGGDMADA
jgi:hypothetical protein